MPIQIIIAVITILLGGAGYWYMKNAEKKKKQPEDDREARMEQTAQEFVNVKDLGESCLYTNDGMIFSYIKVEGLCLELYSKLELRSLSRKCTIALSEFKFPFKYIAVSRPVDVSKTLQAYWELHSTAEGGRRALLKDEMTELTEMVKSGETLERQYYIALWDTVKRVNERDIVKRADELAKLFSENGIKAEVVDRKGIVKLCNLVNIPAYVHLEGTSDIDTMMAVLKDG